MKKNEGVKICSLPPSQRSMAVALRRADTRVDPRGAMRSVSRTYTIVCVHMRPMCVMRNPEMDIFPLRVSYQGISFELWTPLFAS